MNYKGKFRPKNRQKYKGNADNINFRSSWEYAFMNWCDTNPRILKWNSEEIRIPYISSINNNKRRLYHVDFWMILDDGKEYLVEIKPEKQTRPPAKPKVNNKKAIQNYLYMKSMYENNLDKWNAALEYSNKRKIQFVVMTEKKLRRLGIPING